MAGGEGRRYTLDGAGWDEPALGAHVVLLLALGVAAVIQLKAALGIYCPVQLHLHWRCILTL